MKASEIRIGNWVRTIITNTPIKISIDELLNIINDPDDHQLESIPITEEWLVRFGFEKVSGKDGFYLNDWRFHISSPINYDGFLLCEGYYVISDRIQHVHQLQNLYFALTGEELEQI